MRDWLPAFFEPLPQFLSLLRSKNPTYTVS
jgi:hypothetical protein